jgi:hypothetical protein
LEQVLSSYRCCRKKADLEGRLFIDVRPAWAHSCGCKSRRKLTTVSEAKRNCGRVTDRGKEAWSINHEPMDKNCIEGVADQGERASNREALVVKDQAA